MTFDKIANAQIIRGADSYNPVADMWIVTTYFNPSGYKIKSSNYEAFAATLTNSGLNWIVVECAFGDSLFDLVPSENCIQVRARDVMWQKERLINLAIRNLPGDCTKVAWLDSDILFANPDWAVQTSRLLESYAVVQPFDWAIRLPRGKRCYEGEGDRWKGFAAVYATEPDEMLNGRFDKHGHTGFAWAARREILEQHGLYDACISGSGDHMMAHGFCGDWESNCIDRIFGGNVAHQEHFAAWCRRMYCDVRAKVGYVPGTLLHLWHGDMDNRRYVLRNQELALFEFDPASDIRLGSEGCWEWNSAKTDLHRWAVNYYYQRKEDGEARSDRATGWPSSRKRAVGERSFGSDEEYIAALEAALVRAHLEIDYLKQLLERARDGSLQNHPLGVEEEQGSITIDSLSISGDLGTTGSDETSGPN